MNCYLQVELLLLPHNNNKKRNKTAEKIRSTRISQCLQQKNSGASFDALSEHAILVQYTKSDNLNHNHMKFVNRRVAKY